MIKRYLRSAHFFLAHPELFQQKSIAMTKSKQLKQRNPQFETLALAIGVTICMSGIIVTCWSALTTEALVPWGLF